MTRARKLANLGNQNAFTVDSGSLNVGIGSTRPDYKLDVDGTAYVGGGVTISGNLSVGGTVTYEDVTNVDAVGIITANSGVNIVGGGLTVTGVGTFFSGVGIADSIFHLGNTNTLVRFPADNTISAETAGTERLRISGTGRVLIGTNASRQTRISNSGFSGLVQIESDAELGFTISRFVNTDGGPRFVLQKARGTAASPTIVQDGDLCGQLLFSAWDGDNFSNLAKINVDVDGTPGDDDMPGSMTFYTTPDGSNTTTERLRINSSGQIELRKNNSNVQGRPDNRIVFKDLDASVHAEQPIGEISWYSSDSGNPNVNSWIRGINGATNGAGALTFGVKDSGEDEIEALRIAHNGRVGIGTTIPDTKLEVFNGCIKVDRRDTTASGDAHITLRTGPSGGSRLEIYGSSVSEDNSNWIFKTNSNEEISFRIASSEIMHLQPASKVGIGTTIADGNLHVMPSSAGIVTAAGDANELVLESATNVGMSFLTANDSLCRIKFGDPDDNNAGIIAYSHSNNSMRFHTNDGSEALRIDSSGNIVFAKTTTEIKTDTDDGSDNKRIIICGGGDNSQSRGAQVLLYGNEYSSHNGRLQLLAGDAGSSNGVIEFYTGSAERLRITSSGTVGIGTDNPSNKLHIYGNSPVVRAELHPSNTSENQDVFRAIAGPTGSAVFNIRAADASDDNSDWILKTNASEDIIFNIGGVERAHLTAGGALGIGTTAPDNRLHVASTTNSIVFVESYDTNSDIIQADTGGSTRIRSAGGVVAVYGGGDAGSSSAANSSNCGIFANNRFAVGMTPVTTDSSSNFSAGLIQTDGNIDLRFAGTNTTGGAKHVCFVNTDTTLVADQPMGGLNWVGNDSSNPSQLMAQIVALCGGNAGEGSHIRFSTTGTQRMILHDNGSWGVGTGNESTYNDNTDASSGISFNGPSKYTSVARYQGTPFFVNRMDGDGNLVAFYESGSNVGTIAVSGNTVSYNPFLGCHKGRLSDGSKPTILEGTIVETISQSIEWKTATISNVGSASSTVVIPYYGVKTSGTDTVSYGGASYTGTVGFSSNYQLTGNNKHVCIKVSDTASSKAVGGVFVGWDNSVNDAKDNGLDEPYNDLRVGGVGNFFIRIKSGETVAIGDLVESNGDGTGKVQSDDIIRSKTVGKITSTNVIKTYSDGSFLVTAVLYAG